MSNITPSLEKLQQIDGFIGAALVDSDSGMTLGIIGGGNMNLEVAAAGNTEVVRAKRKTMSNLNLRDEIEDILITMGKHYHLLRPMRVRPGVFFYLALDRTRANLAMARLLLADAEKNLQILSQGPRGSGSDPGQIQLGKCNLMSLPGVPSCSSTTNKNWPAPSEPC